MQTKFLDNEQLLAATDITTDPTGTLTKVVKGRISLAIVATIAGQDAADATFTLQGSNDGTNWASVGSAVTIASGSVSLSYDGFNFKRLRVISDGGSNTTGTLALSITANYA